MFNEPNNYCNNISPQRNKFDTLCFTNKSTPIPNEPSKTFKKYKLPKKVVHSCTFDFNENHFTRSYWSSNVYSIR